MSSTDSSNESDNFEEYGISPYCHEPTKSKMSVKYDGDEDEELSSSDNEDQDDTRIGNNSWCLCGQCIAMSTSVESLCCGEMNEISEQRLSGTKVLFISNLLFEIYPHFASKIYVKKKVINLNLHTNFHTSVRFFFFTEFYVSKQILK